jgi:hypothetical protein
VVAAPDAPSGDTTGDMAAEIARRTGFGLVVASGVSPDIHEQRVRAAAQGALRFYAEIHGRDRQPCAGRIEIGTVGVDRELVLRLRALAELIRDAHLRAHDEVPRLDVLIEPVDGVSDPAVRLEGALRGSERALHIALPRCARRDWRETYTAILAEFLAEAVTLSASRSSLR